MASAVLAGRRGAHHPWGENRAPTTPLAPAPNPNPGRHALPRPDSSKAPPLPPPPLASPASDYLMFRPAGLSHREAAALRERLNGELGQVRALLSRIDTWQREPHQPQQQPNLPAPAPPAKLRAAMRKRCAQVLARLQKDKRSIWFNAPVAVEALGLHDYHAVIRRPMDLGTVKAGLSAGRYPSHDAFAADVRLTFANALRYNPVGHDVHTFAGDLLASFEKMYGEAVSWFEKECKRLAPPKQKPAKKVELPPPRVVPVPVKPKVVKMRKPKAREPNKRGMSLDEKNMLRVGLESLPEEKMHNVLQIVRKRSVNNPELLGDEIELDIHEMDIETQWELDRFVNNFNKALKKSRRAAMVNGDIAEVGDTAGAESVNGAAPTFVDDAEVESKNPEKKIVVSEQVDEYVDIEDEMPTATYQSVEIEKGAEVVSVTGSGSSSSSGSESGSSGGSVSEAGNARSLV